MRGCISSLSWLHIHLTVLNSANNLELNLRKSPSVSSHLLDMSPHVLMENLTMSLSSPSPGKKNEQKHKPTITKISLHEPSDTDTSIKLFCTQLMNEIRAFSLPVVEEDNFIN